MNTDVHTNLAARIARIDSLPSIPAVVRPLLELLSAPNDNVDVDKIIETISHDKTIVAQVLRMCNSVLFSPLKPVQDIRGGVLSLGIRRVREVVLSCTFCQTLRFKETSLDPIIFWRHSFGTALVCRKFSNLIGFPDADSAYLAGLLHDIGFQVNSLLDPQGWKVTVQQALSTKVPLLDVELSVLGYTHCQTGRILAEQWALPSMLADTIEFHHAFEDRSANSNLVAIVHLSDLFCRMRGMGYGYCETLCVDFIADPAWTHLAKNFHNVSAMDLALFTFELDALMEGAQKAVEQVFSVPALVG